ncbi:MAG: hypothetical protein AB8C95_09980, partial [Phycisphaeraceae bacterium]
MKTRTKTLLTAVVASTAIIAGSADAATTYVWTGAGAPNENVNNAANWLVNGVVPAAAPSDNGGQPATPGIDDVLLFDSLSATWVAPPRVARKLFSNTPDRPWGSIVVNNGTIDFKGDSNSFRNRSWSGTNTVVVGDGDANAAVLNLFLYELNAGTSTIGGSPSPNDTKTYVVNSDGTLVNGQLGSSGNSTDLTWSNNATLDTVMRLLGGTSIIDVAIDEASILDDAGDYVSFEALGST